MKQITFLLLIILFLFQGCGGNTAGTSQQLTSDDAMQWFKEQVQRYADGGMMLDEQGDFPEYLNALKQDYPEKATLLETELQKLAQEPRVSLPKKAKALLEKL